MALQTGVILFQIVFPRNFRLLRPRIYLFFLEFPDLYSLDCEDKGQANPDLTGTPSVDGYSSVFRWHPQSLSSTNWQDYSGMFLRSRFSFSDDLENFILTKRELNPTLRNSFVKYFRQYFLTIYVILFPTGNCIDFYRLNSIPQRPPEFQDRHAFNTLNNSRLNTISRELL